MDEVIKILVVCSNQEFSIVVRDLLGAKENYSVNFVMSREKALEISRQNIFDVVLLQLDDPDSSSKDFINELKRLDPNCIIIALIEDSRLSESRELIRWGVYDFISKPVNHEAFFLLIKKGAQLHSLSTTDYKIILGLKEHGSSLEKQNILLASRIEESTKNLSRLYEDLRSTYMRTIRVLAQAIDARDHYTHSHSRNVAAYAVVIAREMGFSVQEIENIREACELHDLGKIGISDAILTKEGSLNEEEWKKIKTHPVNGAKILEPLIFLKDVIELIRQHHEHYDGSGYPEGRKGEDILLGARIIHLADAYESMRSARSYRKVPLTKEEAVMEIKRNSGTQFDPKVVGVFLRILDRLVPVEI
ncbi:MAG: HD domain-containing protein [Candidatus Omnitrophica bacterium]|nr:HD domain-containing protein [Candidatus Omnitrophota bacterium]